ncbi:PREDICTED: uncharacterized protein LOC109126622 [Camelina sativa]|uniref:Uncharacterized protein LOC109126622 n=1 Tax=Camelina sativa TaxID=90675 RepID=A0ABM1QGI8_CAMSA|nr:PREDICTED: uncharacterized protein LOC109126622 [Camelina sativa]
MLKSHGFKRSKADHTLFTHRTSRGIVVVLIYVDDIIISGDDKDGIQNTKAFLHSTFAIKDLGELKYFLGIEIYRSSEGLFLSQRKYALDLLSETGKLGVKPAPTPLEEGYQAKRKGEHKQNQDKDAPLDPLHAPYEDVTRYRCLVGKLIYLTITRHDLCYAVNEVSQFMKAATKYHWSMVERILS